MPPIFPFPHLTLWVLPAFFALFAALPVPIAVAVQPDERLENPALEERARDLSAELRCLVCQNESIDSSNAPLARDLRLLVRERLVEGDTNEEVLDFVVARYGDYVLLRPPFQANTLVLWIGPAVIFLLAAGGVGLYLARKGKAHQGSRVSEAPLSAEEQAALARLLEETADTAHTERGTP